MEKSPTEGRDPRAVSPMLAEDAVLQWYAHAAILWLCG